jgi:methanogenic corrinoid protein MtbC1
MSQRESLSSDQVLHSARALAGYAAGELLESRPELGERHHPAAFPRWQNVFVQCLEELAAAMATRRPQVLARHLQWLDVFFRARGMPRDVLLSGLEILTGVLERELPEGVAADAVGVCREASAVLRPETTASRSSLDGDTPHGRLAGSYLLALLEGDRARATRLVLDAADAGVPIQELYLNVLLPAQEEGGRMWLEAEINVAEEHFTTATTQAIMAQLRGRVAPHPALGKTILTAAVLGNQHDIGLQAVADFFEMDGWRVIQLGCNVPLEDLVEAVEFYQADLLGLSVCLGAQLTALARTIAAIRQSARGSSVKILVGGRGLASMSDLAAELGADGCADDPTTAVTLGRKLVGLD